MLWNGFLRKHPVRFHRQYVIGNYIADFYCHKAKLVIELDGSQHYDPDERQKDIQRTQYLESQGLRVLRYTNLEVMQSFHVVCESVDAEVRIAMTAPNSFSRGEAVSEAD